MRRGAYLAWLTLVVAVSLVASMLYPAIVEARVDHRPLGALDAVVMPLYDAVTPWPVWMYRKLGGSIALPWGWPVELRFSLTLMMVLVPFWFVAGVPFVELFLTLRRRSQEARRDAPA